MMSLNPTGPTLSIYDGITPWASIFIVTSQSANTVFAGPTSGPPAAPTFRALVSADITSVSWSVITGTPTTLAGYGITNASTTSTGSGAPVSPCTAGNPGSIYIDTAASPRKIYICDGSAWKQVYPALYV